MPGVWTNLIVGPLCVGWGKEGVGGGCVGWRGWKGGGGGGLLEERGELIDCLECWFCLVMTQIADCRFLLVISIFNCCNTLLDFQ